MKKKTFHSVYSVESRCCQIRSQIFNKLLHYILGQLRVTLWLKSSKIITLEKKV